MALGMFTGLSSLFGTDLQGDNVFAPQPGAVPAGFDAIVQISTKLLDWTLARNLAAGNLDPLSARVPYQPEQVSPKLRALIQPLLSKRPVNSVVDRPPPQIEVQILDPVAQPLSWPPPVDGLPGGTMAAAVGPGRGKKTLVLVWTVQVNLFWPAPPVQPTTMGGGTTGGSSTTGGRGALGVSGASGTLTNSGQVVVLPPPLPDGERTLLTQGTATMSVPSQLSINSALYQFQLVVNFEGVKPSYASGDPVMTEFLKTPLATSLLAQAIAPLLNQYAVGLSPTIALAGSLSPTQVAQTQLPALHVDDMVLSDNKGQLIAFCVTLGNDSHGAFSMVIPFLAGQDFAYYASGNVFTPVLKGLWLANAILTPVVSDVPVQLPVSQGSSEMGTGRARVQVNLSNTLSEAALIASTDSALGDPMRLVSQQTVQLLALWDPGGNQITDLGGLAKAATLPFALTLQMFDKVATVQHTLQPPLSTLLWAMLRPLYFPMVEQYAVTAVGGFTSSPLSAIVSRWSLPRPASTVGPTIGGLTSV
jgi:hypothetical protein